MQVIGVSPAFGAGKVYVTPKNNGEDIRRIVQKFNDELVPEKDNISDSVNFMLPAAGAGTKLKALTTLTGNYNKISFPFPVTDTAGLYMIEFPLNLGKKLVDKSGYEVVSSPAPSGNFAPVVEHYMLHPEDTRPVMYMGADTIVDISSQEFADIVKSDIKSGVHVDLFGMYKTPEETADNFGLFVVDEKDMADKNPNMGLKLFLEKKPLDETKKYAIYDGKNIANTGVTFFSREAIQRVMDRLKYEQEHPEAKKMFAKNEQEKYNTANVMDYLFEHYNEFFGQNFSDGVRVRLVPNWEDLGIVKAYCDFIKKLKTGEFLGNFSPDKAQKIMSAVKNRTGIKDGRNLFVISAKIPSINALSEKDMAAAHKIEGYDIIA